LANAAIPLAGWGYSFGNWLYDGRLPWDDDGAGLWDPPAENAILEGRITLRFDPTYYQINNYGWFGDWGVDTTLSPPPVGVDPEDPAFANGWVLQDSNPLMTTNIELDNENGYLVVEYSWGSAGYTAPTSDHFNFFGYTYSVLPDLTNEQLQQNTTGSYGPGKMVILGSPRDVELNGTNAQTYMLCTNGYCGEPIPEPTSAIAFLAFGTLGAASTLKRKLKPSNPADKELEKVS
jgi:hypothetical protein